MTVALIPTAQCTTAGKTRSFEPKFECYPPLPASAACSTDPAPARNPVFHRTTDLFTTLLPLQKIAKKSKKVLPARGLSGILAATPNYNSDSPKEITHEETCLRNNVFVFGMC